jgi:hypothetical protein
MAADGGLSNAQQAGNLLVRQVLFEEGPHNRQPQLLGGLPNTHPYEDQTPLISSTEPQVSSWCGLRAVQPGPGRGGLPWECFHI